MSRLLRSSKLQWKSSLAWCRTPSTVKGARIREFSVFYYASNTKNAMQFVLPSPSQNGTRLGVRACGWSYSTTVKEPQSDEMADASEKVRSSNLGVVEDLLSNVQVDEVEEAEEQVATPKRSTPLSIEECVAILREENACNVLAIKLGSKTAKWYASYLVTCSGTSTRHLKAMTDRLKAEVSGWWSCDSHVTVTLLNLQMELSNLKSAIPSTSLDSLICLTPGHCAFMVV